jgi:uncharacterized membrane protein YGL010W
MLRPIFGPGLQARVQAYDRFHRTLVNRAIHFAGIPLLGVGSLGLLSQAAIPAGVGITALEPNLAWLAMAFAAGWYLALGRIAGLAPFAVVASCYAVGSLLSVGVLLAIFGAGVVAHFVGHFGFEGKPPATFYDPRSVLDAPAWLVHLLLAKPAPLTDAPSG